MSKSILYLLVLCVLSFGCKVKEKASAVPVVAAPNAVEKATANVVKSAVEVDSHGQAMDTDGDGIPDYRDHEKLTSSKCFPADENGVGNCPEPSCCAEFRGSPIDTGYYNPYCQIGTFEISFAKGSSGLSDSALKVLNLILQQTYANPQCKLLVGTGCGVGKKAAAVCWDRMKNVIAFFKKGKIEGDRIVIGYDLTNREDVVVIKGTLNKPEQIPTPATKNKGGLK